MNEQNREREIFEAALELPSSEERIAYVEQACGEDLEMADRIKALLEVEAEGGGFLPGVPNLSAEGPGMMIDRYKLLEQIGEGGFGVVYMAEQVEPVRRKVALKIIKPGMDSKQVIGRFEAERQALAMMDHPHIAQVFDAGATEAGRPYFVMELVQGIPITELCVEQQLDLESRLDLFIEVCAAVQHAHQKGIIHRDLKPSNIMVTMHGDKPVPKVIDFGIAKATAQPLTDETVFTQFQQFLGTPAYMSPEQAALSGLDVDTRSDIYSLGVLLYELLTGSPPFETKALLSAGLDEMRRILREEEPLRPSTKLSKSRAEARQAAGPAAPPMRRPSSIASDLDWIVMKALEKDRTRRYETANGLAADLKRYLGDEPVTAVAPSFGYQLRKFARRHKAALAFATTIAVVLVIATAVSSWLAFRAWKAEREQAGLWQQAEDARSLAAGRAEDLAHQVYRMHLDRVDVALDNLDFEVARSELEACDPSQRHWEWSYRMGRLPPRVSIPAGQQPIFRRDGSLAMVGLGDRNHLVILWDPATGEERDTLIKSEGSVACFAMSPDEKFYATGQRDGRMVLWNKSGEELWSIEAHSKRTDGLVFSSDGGMIASCGWDGRLKLWNAGDGALIREWDAVGYGLRGVVLSPDGKRIAAGTGERSAEGHAITVWHTESGEALFTLRDENWGMKDVAFSPDGRWIATAASNGNVRLWDASTGVEDRMLAEASLPDGLGKGCITFSEDSTRLVTTSGHGVRLVEVPSGELKAQFYMPDLVPGRIRQCWWARLSPDNRWLGAYAQFVGRPGVTIVWGAISSAGLVPAHRQRAWSVAYSADGTVVSGGGDASIGIWDAGKRELVRSIPARDGRFVAVDADGTQVLGGGMDGTVQIWDVGSGESVRSYLGAPQNEEGDQFGGALSRDGRFVAAAGRDKVVRIWNRETGGLLHELEGHGKASFAVYSVAFTPDSAVLASAAGDGTVRIWDVGSGECLRILKGRGELVAVRFNPGHATVAAASSDRTIYRWDYQTGEALDSLSGGHSRKVWSLAYSPDGERLAAGDMLGTLVMWDTKTGDEILRQNSDQYGVWGLAWSPDGTTIVSAGHDGSVRFWEGSPVPSPTAP